MGRERRRRGVSLVFLFLYRGGGGGAVLQGQDRGDATPSIGNVIDVLCPGDSTNGGERVRRALYGSTTTSTLGCRSIKHGDIPAWPRHRLTCHEQETLADTIFRAVMSSTLGLSYWFRVTCVTEWKAGKCQSRRGSSCHRAAFVLVVRRPQLAPLLGYRRRARVD